MTDEESLEAIAATEVERLHRLTNLGARGTAGPDADPQSVPVLAGPDGIAAWSTDGWWAGARRAPAHPGRIGGPIKSWSTGLHTTDMLPDEWDALLTSWTTKPADGACAHFVIGRDEAHGVVQLVPITHNGNHLGGPGHGVFVVNGQQIHPNLVAIGIELHCAGGVRQVAGQWRLVEDGKAHGAPLLEADVIPDPARPGRGIHKITDYQFQMLRWLLDDIDAAQMLLPKDVTTKAFGEVPEPFTVMPSARVVTHAQMDPVHRADPWLQGCLWLRAYLLGSKS